MNDLRYAWRVLLGSPGFTAVVVLTLGLGIGASTAIFSVVDAVLLRPLPYPEPRRLVYIQESWRGESRTPVAWPKLIDWREQSRSFDSMAGANWGGHYTLTGGDRPERIAGNAVDPSFFTMLGVSPILGRDFTAGDSRPGSPRTVLLTHQCWKSRFGSDPLVLDRTLTLNFEPHRVIGVLPPAFRAPGDHQLFVPMVETEGLLTNREDHSYQALGRLKRGVAWTQAEAELNAIAARLEEAHPASDRHWRVKLTPLHELLAGGLRGTLAVLMGAVGLVLLIACANIANLLLARGSTRRREIALRVALGAGRGRVVRQLLTEGVLLAVCGGAVGVVLAPWFLELLLRLRPESDSSFLEVRLDLRVLLFVAALSAMTGILFSLVPALSAVRGALSEALREGERGTSQALVRNPARSLLVVSQVALALVLLIGAGLLLRTYSWLQAVDPGFTTVNVLTVPIEPPRARYPEQPGRARLFDQLIERLKAIPGVEEVGGVHALPMGSGESILFTKVHGQPPLPDSASSNRYRVITPEYFRALGIPVLRGRPFDARDGQGSPLVVVVNEAFARRVFPGEDPLGQRLGLGDGHYRDGDHLPREIVGVVRDIRLRDLKEEPEPAVYVPHAQSLWRYGLTLVVRAHVKPASIQNAVRETVWALDRDLPVEGFRTMEDVLSSSLGSERFNAGLLGTFAAAALLLAALGIYGVISCSVAQRTRELGIRMALGADPGKVVRLVLGQGMALAALGLLLGLLGAVALTRVLGSLLHGVSPTDPLVFVSITAFLGAVALLASYLPARRAVRVDPLTALRYE